MMQIRENLSLRPYNSFGIDVIGRYVASFVSIEELKEILETKAFKNQDKKLVLGGGSNILLTQDFNGIILKNEITQIQFIGQDQEYHYVKAGAGENWHSVVLYCLSNNLAGVENLALIPGSVGASPIQNIGAYGVEIKDVFHELEAVHLGDGSLHTFKSKNCAFGYRDSIFKRTYKEQFVITSVTYRLLRKPRLNTSYSALHEELEKMNPAALTIHTIAEAVMRIRSSKLPDPQILGNAGSFFKNPQIPYQKFKELKSLHQNIPSFPFEGQLVKIPAGWLIEQCGWKGSRKGDVGCYAKQALVLVNYGKASGQEIYNLSEQIVQSVEDKFDIHLDREVNIF
ncbi:MAG: UDP-N-acetylmuramate dehydrogenase [Flavisolibacter sp.]